MIERDREPAADGGFTLLEVVVTVGVIAIVLAGAVGTFAGIAKSAAPDQTRDLAMMAAENVLVRARAAASYAPDPLPDADIAALRTFADTRTWVLATGPRTFTVSGTLVAASAVCGRTGTLDVPLAVTADYEEAGTPPARTFTVSVAYPVNPCLPAVTRTVVLSEDLPALAFVPGTRVTQALAAPPWGQ